MYLCFDFLITAGKYGTKVRKKTLELEGFEK